MIVILINDFDRESDLDKHNWPAEPHWHYRGIANDYEEGMQYIRWYVWGKAEEMLSMDTFGVPKGQNPWEDWITHWNWDEEWMNGTHNIPGPKGWVQKEVRILYSEIDSERGIKATLIGI